MKKLLLVCVLMAFAGSVAAQPASPIDKGSMIIGGTLGFSSSGGDLYKDTADNSITTITLNPEFGYFVIPSLVVGATIGYDRISQGDYNASVLGIGPWVGYYFNINKARTEVKGSIYPYLKGFFTYSTFTQEGDDTDEKIMSFGARGGIDFMLSNAVALDAGLQFESDSYDSGVSGAEKVKGTVFGLNVGIAAFVW